MFIITVLAAFCCCLRLCISQATRLPYRDLADSYVAFLVLDSERPNTRGPPSPVRTSAGFPAYSMLHPVSVAVGVNRDGGIAPDGSLAPQRLKAFAQRTNVREQYRLHCTLIRPTAVRSQKHRGIRGGTPGRSTIQSTI